MRAVLIFACVVLWAATVSARGGKAAADPSYCECIGPGECSDSNVRSLCPTMCQPRACPDGFVTLNGKCYKMFKDERRTWNQAKTKCEAEGLRLAQPADEAAVALRKDLLDIYGDDSRVWLDARGDGDNIVWQRDGSELPSDNKLWSRGEPGRYVGRSWCLYLQVSEYHWRDFPQTPYFVGRCSHSQWLGYNPRYALCEVNL